MTDDSKQITDQFPVSAQLTTADVKALASRGIKSLICNRPDGEAADQLWWQAIAELSAMGY